MSSGYSTMPPSAPHKMIPPPSDATEDKKADEMTCDIKTTGEKRGRKRKWVIMSLEDGSGDDKPRKRRRTSSVLEEKRECENEQDMVQLQQKIDIKKRLLDVIPSLKTKEDVLSYEINWDVSDKYELPEIMRPWISEKIAKFLKEDGDENEIAHCIMAKIQSHHSASSMLMILETVLKDEAETFFVNLWRMLILEIKKAETVREIAKHYSNVKLKEERSKRSNCARDVNNDSIRDSDSYQDLLILLKTFDSKMLSEVEQFIDTIPKTKEVLFSYEINWLVSDKHELYNKMRPWLSQKVKAFEKLLKVDEGRLVDHIVTSMASNVSASTMLEMLQVMMEDKGEMFFLDLWRMLIFEIKKLETVAEFAKSRSNEERSQVVGTINMLSGERLSHLDQDWDDVESSNCARDVNKDDIRDSKSYLQFRSVLKFICKKRKRLEVEQFIDMIPKRKEELLSYKINWALCDRHKLHKKMGPWITENFKAAFDKVVSSTAADVIASIKDHAQFSQMVDHVQPILDYNSEKFVLTMLRLLIFAIKSAGLTAESAERTSNANPKEDRSEVAQEINRPSCVRLNQQDRGQMESTSCAITYTVPERYQRRLNEILKLHGPSRIYELKRIADMIPKTKEELFSYNLNWGVYEKYLLHRYMRGWVSREILEFVGQEEATLVVGYILSSIKDHVPAMRMQERLQPILGDRSEMFVWKMWGKLIFATNVVLLR